MTCFALATNLPQRPSTLCPARADGGVLADVPTGQGLPEISHQDHNGDQPAAGPDQRPLTAMARGPPGPEARRRAGS